jgi:DNA-binding MarR family transcriptional regulator
MEESLDQDSQMIGESDHVFGLIKTVRKQMRAEIDRRMEALALTDAQWRLVLLLADGGGGTASELARRSMQSSGGMTRAIDRLESKGIIRRIRSNEDRRVVNLELTDKGHFAANRVPAIVHEVNEQVLMDFNAEDVKLLKGYLLRILTTL